MKKPNTMLKDLLPTNMGVTVTDTQENMVQVYCADNGTTATYTVSPLYSQGDEWYIAQLSKHVCATMGLTRPVYSRSAR